MAFILADRVKETTITTGTSDLVLGGAFGGFRTFSNAIGNGNSTYYGIESSDGDYEVGIGTYTSASNTLSRDTVISSSNSGSKISLTGVSTVFVTQPGTKALFVNPDSYASGVGFTGYAFPDGTVQATSAIDGAAPAKLRRSNAGVFFQYFVDNGNDRTVALHLENEELTPQWKMGLKNSPSSQTEAPSYGYVFGENGSAGAYADANNAIYINTNNGFWVVHESASVFNVDKSDGSIFKNGTASTPTLTVRGAAAQSAKLQQWETSAESVVASVDNAGKFICQTLQFGDGTSQTKAADLFQGNNVSLLTNDAGYITTHPNISAATSVDNSSPNFIQDITLDSNGHVVGITSAASYNHWRLSDDSSGPFNISDNEELKIAGGDNVTTSYDGTYKTLTITATDTNTTYTAGNGLVLAGTEFSAPDIATASGALRQDITSNTASVSASGYKISGVLQPQITDKISSSVFYNSGQKYLEERNLLTPLSSFYASGQQHIEKRGDISGNLQAQIDGISAGAEVYNVASGVIVDNNLYAISGNGGLLANKTNWDTAYGWGNHASAGYLTSYTETNNLSSAVTWANVPNANITESSVTQHQAALSITESQISDFGSYLTSQTSHADVVVDGDFGSEGLMKRGGSAGSYSIVTDNSSNWNTAHGWGNHASAGYLTSETWNYASGVSVSGTFASYAPLASPTFTGTPAAPTAAAATNTTQIATTAFVRTEISNLVDSAPGALDTLNELAAAINDDASFSTTVTNSIATKIGNVVEDTTPQLGGTLDANSNSIDMGTNTITDTKVGQWDTAYGWGNHASAGYISATLTTEQVQDIVGAMFSGNTETDITATYQDGDGTIDLVATNTTYSAGNGIALSSTTFSVSAGNGLAQDSDGLKLDDPANLTELTESTDATDDKILLWDEDASTWKYMTLDNLQDSIDTTGGGGGGGSVTTVKANGSQVGGADIVTLDFSSDFTVAETPDTEINISIGTLNQNTTGSAATLTTAREINGVAFDGSANITVTAAGSTLSDTVPVSKGGTGATALDDKAVLITQDTGTDTVSAAVMDANGELLIGGTSGPAVGTLTAGTNITVTNSDGGITIASTDTNTQLSDEQVQDIVGAMVTSNTETGITVTYQDADGTLDFAIATLNQDTTGNAATATALETARTINGTSFDGTANITITAAGSTLSDTVTVAKGGTGQTTYTNGQLLIGNTTGNTLSKSTLTAGSNVTITNGTGTITIAADNDNTQLSNEQVQDIVGGMVTGNTETGITVTYQDGDGTLDFAVGTLNQNTTGNAATATALETARTINGTSFDGTANITVTAAGSTLSDTVPVSKGGTGATSFADKAVLITQDTGTDTVSAAVMDANGELLIGGTSGPAVATLTAGSNITITNADGGITIAADNDNTQLSDEQVQDIVGAMVSSNTESGITVAYQDADGTLDFTVGTLNQDTTGNAATATALETARTINGTSFDGTANITVTAAGSTLSDTVTVAKGGTGQTTFTNGQLLIGNTTGNTLTKSTLTAGSNVTITNGTGSITIAADNDNTQLSEEQVEDFVGGMVTGNTETGISVTYQDADGTLDFAVSDTTVAGDSGSTGITPGDTLTIAGGTNATTSMSGDTLTVNVDDAFLKNDADDTTTGTVTMANLIVGDGGNIGSASVNDSITIAAEGDVTFKNATKPAAPAAASGTSGIVVLNCDTTNHFTITTTGDITGWNFTNASPGQRIIVRITNGASHTVGFSATGDGDVIRFPGGTTPTLTTSGGIDVYGFLCIAADDFDGFIIGQNLS